MAAVRRSWLCLGINPPQCFLHGKGGYPAEVPSSHLGDFPIHISELHQSISHMKEHMEKQKAACQIRELGFPRK
jgi:hypothetical protein